MEISTFIDVFRPLSEASQNNEYRDQLLKYLGWDTKLITFIPIEEVNKFLNEISIIIDSLDTTLFSPTTNIYDFINLLNKVNNLYLEVSELTNFSKSITNSSLSIEVKNELNELGNDLISFLIGYKLLVEQPLLFRTLILLGLIIPFEENLVSSKVDGSTLIRLSFYKIQFKFEKIPNLIKDPLDFLSKEYFPTSYFSSNPHQLNSISDVSHITNKLFPRLASLFQSLGLNTNYGISPLDSSKFGIDELDTMSRMLHVIFDSSATRRFGLSTFISSYSEGNLGLVITPFGNLNFSEQFGNWLTSLSFTSGIDSFSLGPNGLTLPTGVSGGIAANLSINKILDVGETLVYKLGSDTGTRIEIPEFTFNAGLFAEGTDIAYYLEFDLGKSSLVLSPGDGDGFISKILPKEGTVIPFDLGLGYSSSKGLYFKGGSAGLEVKLPVKKTDEKKPGIRIDSVTLSIKPNDDDSIPVKAAVSFTVQIGAVTAIVDEVGLYADLSFPESGGNLGPVDLDFGFKPPTGIGINIEGSTVSGGGFLSIDSEAGRYQGALDLKFSEISISAIGLLQTKLPSGNDGYSLLVLMAASFTPAIQLGFGFTLDKIGGIAGLHRMMNAEAIRDGVRQGKMGKVMFSDSPSKNANEILSVLDRYFPVAENKFVFGPMLRINWGTPSLISLEAALLIQTDPWEFAIAGILSSTLPSKENPLICLNVAFIGVVSPSKQSLKIDASLYNSKILTYQLHGDMSVRFFWGERGGFLLSAGGFHPSYQAPPEMEVRQDMRRMSLSLYSSDKVKIGAEAYFAVTSNTVQFGTQIYLIAKCGEVSAKAHLGFDALLFYKPKLQFTVDISAGASLYTFGENIGSVSLKFKLSGPGRWKAVGTATLDVWLLPDVNVDFEEAWGEDVETPSPSIDVYEKVKEALGKDGNWQLEQSGDDGFVRLRQIKEEERVLTPGSKIRIKQLVAPLEVTIDKFGNGKIEGKRKFKIINPKIQYKDETTWSDASFDPNVKDQFAPAEYFNLSTDSQSLLTRPGFEYHTSGLVIKGLPETDQISIGSMRRKNMTMQQILIDKNTSGEIVINEPTSITELLSVFEGSLWNNAASQAPLSANVVDTPVYSPVTSYAIAQEQYVVVKSEDMSRHEPAVAYETRSEAQQKIRELLTDKQVKEGELLAVPLHELN